MFELNKEYTREVIHSTCEGSKQAFLPENGKVVAACRMDLNSQAPDIIIDGSASARAAGRTLAGQQDAIRYSSRSKSTHFASSLFAVSESLTATSSTARRMRTAGSRRARCLAS
jgi:hypothetical protein